MAPVVMCAMVIVISEIVVLPSSTLSRCVTALSGAPLGSFAYAAVSASVCTDVAPPRPPARFGPIGFIATLSLGAIQMSVVDRVIDCDRRPMIVTVMVALSTTWYLIVAYPSIGSPGPATSPLALTSDHSVLVRPPSDACILSDSALMESELN